MELYKKIVLRGDFFGIYQKKSCTFAAEFELHGLPIINEEMEKVSDQKGSIIFKDTRKNADKRAKDAFANGVERIRKETNNSFEGLIVVLNVVDPDTNKPIQVDKVTL